MGVTAYKRLHPPLIYNADTIEREEGLIGYDHDAERLCYTDSTLTWRCMALVDELSGAGSHDFVSAMLLVTNTVVSAPAGHTYPLSGYKRLVDWTTAAPRVSSPNFSTVTGRYTAATMGKFKIDAQVSWQEVQKNTGIRVLRIIHTSTLAVTTIMAESVVNPSSNKNVNTMQICQAGVALDIGDIVHVEVAQTCGIAKDVEGGTTPGSAGTTLQIVQVS
jgi:hypothetical protein